MTALLYVAADDTLTPRPTTIGGFDRLTWHTRETPPHPSFPRVHSSSINNLLPQSSSSQLRLCSHSCRISSPVPDETSIMAEYDTVPQEADDKQEALEEPGVDQRTDGQEDTSEQPPRDREDPISSSKDETSGTDERIIRRPPSPLPYYDCRDVDCTWPCAHHFHSDKNLNFEWYPELEHCRYQHPEIPRLQSEMKDCQFCRIFFTIGQSHCSCGANSQNDHIPESGGCRCEVANSQCRFQSNGQLSHVFMSWACGYARYELGLPTGKVVWSIYGHSNESFLTRPLALNARVFPYIAPCMGDLHCDPGCDESLALIKDWIDDCRRCHQLCKVPQQVGGPKRLLRCLSDGSVRLEAQNPTQRRDYIALPYCWGDGKAVTKTTKDTVDLYHRWVPNESLPPLYREAVALARGLNIHYLWIDSLCIIQDSKEDKDEELMRMSDIYRGAFVVVVVATAESPLDSLLRVKPQHDQSHTWHTASLIDCEEMDLVHVKFRKRPENAHVRTDATAFTPTGKRAWCFQEKLLACRCLVFCEDEVVWECRSCCLCECGKEQKDLSVAPAGSGSTWSSRWPSETMEPYRKLLLPLAEHEPFQLDGTLKYFADAEAAYSFWEPAVAKFSMAALTYKTDRLPAISAVASIVGKATGDRYLAGLWREDLLAGLGWVASPGSFVRTGDPRPYQEYIAPTWSWASLSYGAYYCRDRTRQSHDADLDTLVDRAWAVLEGQNPYGPVSDAAIVFSGLHHCDAELTIAELVSDLQLDFGHGDLQKMRLGMFFGTAQGACASKRSTSCPSNQTPTELLDICVASRIRQKSSLIVPAPSVCSGLRNTYVSFLRRPAERRGRMRDWEFSTQRWIGIPTESSLSGCPNGCDDPVSHWFDITPALVMGCFGSWSRGREIPGWWIYRGCVGHTSYESRNCLGRWL